MGVKWILQLRNSVPTAATTTTASSSNPTSSSSSSSQQSSTAILTKRLEALGAKQAGKWRTTVSVFYKRVDQDKPGNQVYLVRFLTDCPDKVYVLTKSQETDIVVEASASFMSIWNKLEVFQLKNQIQVEGITFVLGDFVVRIGSMGSQNPSGISHMLEVEYKPCLYRGDCQDLMREFLEVLVLPDGPSPHAVAYTAVVLQQPPQQQQQRTAAQRSTANIEYCNEHTAQQYVALYKSLTQAKITQQQSQSQQQQQQQQPIMGAVSSIVPNKPAPASASTSSLAYPATATTATQGPQGVAIVGGQSSQQLAAAPQSNLLHQQQYRPPVQSVPPQQRPAAPQQQQYSQPQSHMQLPPS